MVNGEDKNFVRLAICIASYRAKFGEWPTEARLAPLVLWNLAHLLDPGQFEMLGDRLRLSSASDVYLLEVHGKQGTVSYEDINMANDVTNTKVDEAQTWIGVDVRPDVD